jgi:hypothetical protein
MSRSEEVVPVTPAAVCFDSDGDATKAFVTPRKRLHKISCILDVSPGGRMGVNSRVLVMDLTLLQYRFSGQILSTFSRIKLYRTVAINLMMKSTNHLISFHTPRYQVPQYWQGGQ